MRYRSHGPRCKCVECKMTGCGAFSHTDGRAACDGCGARVPIDQLSLTTFIERQGFACEECKRDTVVVALTTGERDA